MIHAVVIKICVLGNSKSNVPMRQQLEVVCVTVVQGVIRRNYGDVVGFCPPKSNHAQKERRVGMDHVKLVSPKFLQHAIEGRIRHGVPTGNRSFYRTAAIRIWVWIAVSGISCREEMNRMPLLPQFPDEGIDAYAYAIQDRKSAIRKDRNTEAIRGQSQSSGNRPCTSTNRTTSLSLNRR